MRWPRVSKWVWVPLALFVRPILMLVALIGAAVFLVVMGETRDSLDRRDARFERFKTLDPEKGERIMLDEPVAETFNSREEMRRAINDIEVPGYGTIERSFRQPDGSTIWLESIEIPERDKDRGLVFREAGGRFVKLDDFVYDSDNYGISDVRIDGERITYVDLNGREVPVIRERLVRAFTTPERDEMAHDRFDWEATCRRAGSCRARRLRTERTTPMTYVGVSEHAIAPGTAHDRADDDRRGSAGRGTPLCAGQSVVGDRRVAAIHLAIRLMIIPGRRASRSGVPTREC